MATSKARDKVGGAMQTLKGRMRERWGVRTGNRSAEHGGQADRLKGGARNKKGHVRDMFK
jgi:uncharacterized protein YjbJ (UPF0337 family)